MADFNRAMIRAIVRIIEELCRPVPGLPPIISVHIQERITKLILSLDASEAIALLGQFNRDTRSAIIDMAQLFVESDKRDVCEWMLKHCAEELDLPTEESERLEFIEWKIQTSNDRGGDTSA